MDGSLALVALEPRLHWRRLTRRGHCEPETWGLDAAFPAAFLALLAPHVRERPGQVAALLGAGIAIALTPIAPAGVPLLVASLAVVPGWLVGRREGLATR